jgi:hypothetical protein
MAEAVTLQLSGQQAALLAPILQQICGGDPQNVGGTTPKRSLQRMAGSSVSTPSSSESTSNCASPLGVTSDCVFSLNELLNPKKRGTKGSEAQNYMNVSVSVSITCMCMLINYFSILDIKACSVLFKCS